eukprot:scpid27456/ scgid3187/ Probable 3-hydroxyacyl-CoA dehydrogenase F54C8.1
MIHSAVIGAGPMGSCIAGEVAQHGIKVKIFDVIPGKAAGAVQELTDRLPELMRCGLIEKHCDFASLIRPCASLKEAVHDAEIIFEAVVENERVKRAVFAEISSYCSESCVIASNTLSLDVGNMTKDLPYPHRALAVRFLHPVFGVQGVEITVSRYTSDETKVIVESFLRQCLGKTPFYRKTGPRFPLSTPLGIESPTLGQDPRAISPTTGTMSCESDSYRLPEDVYREHIAALGAMVARTGGRADPGGPGALGFQPPPVHSTATDWKTRPVGAGGHGGHGGPRTSAVSSSARVGYSSPSSQTAAVRSAGHGGPGAVEAELAPVDVPPSGPMPDGPGGPGAFRANPDPGNLHSRRTKPMPDGPGGPGAFRANPDPGNLHSRRTKPMPDGPGGPGAFRANSDPGNLHSSPTKPMPEGPGGPGAFRADPLPSDRQPVKEVVAPQGPGGPGALGTAAVTSKEPSNDGKEERVGSPDGQSQCVVCMDAERDALLCPCHHFCVCATCADAICKRRGECPVCRQIIASIIPVFVS